MRRIAAVLFLAAFIAGCAATDRSQYTRDGVEYGVTKGVFRGRWWSYYERGTSYLAGQHYEEALADFQSALQGRNKDSWRARTYGLHFVEYFPNRELGITLFHLGRLDEAETYLRASLEQIDTERAHHYIDDIKRARIASGAQQDSTAPSIAVATAPAEPVVQAPEVAAPPAAPTARVAPFYPLPDLVDFRFASAPAAMPRVQLAQAQTDATAPAAAVAPQAEAAPPAGGVVTADNEFKLKVDASDDNGVSDVKVNGEALYVRESAPQKEVEKKLDLEEGTHSVQVSATDLAGKEVTQEVPVTVDNTAPNIGVLSPIEPTVTDRGTVILKGSTRDKIGVTSVNVDEQVLAESPGVPQLPFSTELPLGDGENTFLLSARDTVGNEARTAIKVFKGDADSAQAKLWLIREKFPEKLAFATADPQRMTPAFLDAVLAQAEAEAKSFIRLKSPSIAKPYPNSRSIEVSGDVVTQSEVTSLSINGEPIATLSGAPKESFKRRVSVSDEERAAGTKLIVIDAADAAGHKLHEEFTVQVETLGLANPETKAPVAVLGFQAIGLGETVPATLQHQLAASLAERNRFRVLDKAAIDAALGEKQMSADAASPDEAVAIAAALPAQYYLTGTAFAQEAGMELKARLISIETNQVVDTLDTYVPDLSQAGAVEQACNNIATLMEERFPRASGAINSVKGNSLELSLTASEVRPGSYVVLLVKEPGQVDPDSGEVILPGAERVLAKARIERADENGSQATIVEVQEEGAPVEEGMPAVTM